MLPDYPKIKARIAEAHRERVRMAQNTYMGPFAEVPVVHLHEGKMNRVLGVDGSEKEWEPMQMEAETTLQHDPKAVEKLELNDILNILDDLGQKISEKKVEMFFASITDVIQSGGHILQSDKPLVEQFFEGLERISMDFDDQGQPRPPTVFVGKTGAEKMKEAEEQLQSNPEFQKRYKIIIQKKKEEWRDREAARNLVE